jgi:amino acid transporter
MVFVVFGNVAGNCVSFAVRALQASNAEVTNGAVRGISIAIALFTCFIHTVSRRGGILLSNFLAIIKLAMLLMIIIAAIVAAARGFPNKRSFAGENFDSDNSFRNPSTEPYGYASAFLSVGRLIPSTLPLVAAPLTRDLNPVFTFGGFTQPNYVRLYSRSVA